MAGSAFQRHDPAQRTLVLGATGTRGTNKRKRTNNVCLACRTTKLLCGLDRCPILAKLHARTRTTTLVDSLKLSGGSPPSVFVGRFGYPKVAIGPMLPPWEGDTGLLDTPELWPGHSMDEIINFREQMVRTKYEVRVDKLVGAESGGRVLERTRELALAARPVGVEADLLKKPTGPPTYQAHAAPFGPSAPLRSLDGDTIQVDQRIDKYSSDTDLKASPALVELHAAGTFTSTLQRVFSMGLLGEGRRRRLVPTRWSITAVDDTLGKNLLTQTVQWPWLNEYLLFETVALDNRWAVLMMPGHWAYELIEAWYPNTLWNPHRKGIAILSSHEFKGPRKDYAEIGGCYYAARLAVNEKLHQYRRQGAVVIFREAHPGYILPVGVWNVREHVRAALTNPPRKYNTLQEAMNRVAFVMDIPLQRWVLNSAVLKDRMQQRRLDDFIDLGTRAPPPTNTTSTS